MRWAVGGVSFIAMLMTLAIVIAGPGTRLGFWDYSAGLSMIRAVSAPKAIAGGVELPPLFTAAALALALGIVAAFMKKKGAAMLGVAAAIIAGAAGMVPLKMRAAFEGNPYIHEVTTDFDNPPPIIAAADQPRKNPPDYRGGDPVPQRTDGMTVAEAQRQAFPDIEPVVVDAKLAAAAEVAKDIVADMGMEILADGPADSASGGGWRIEAVATSFWFGFKDDFVVRLTPAGDGATRLDVRSKSRVGGSDLGANAERVRAFVRRFKAAI